MLVIPVFSLLAINYKQTGEKVENLEEYKGETLAAGSNGVVDVTLSCPSSVPYGSTVTCNAVPHFNGSQTGAVNFQFHAFGDIQVVSQSGSSVTVRASGGSDGGVTVVETVSGMGDSTSINVIGYLYNISLTPSSATVYTNGSTQTFNINVNTSGGAYQVSCSATSNIEIVSCSNSLVAIRDVSNGSGTLHVSAHSTVGSGNYVDATASITVKTLVEHIALDKSTYDIEAGSTANSTLTIYPTTAIYSNKTYEVENSNIAAVNSSGVITGRANGTTRFRARVVNADGTAIYSSWSTINVTTKVTGVTISPTSATVYMGETKTLTATVSPSTASNKNVTWTSSNTSVATVDSNGKVTPKANGTATITVRTADGNYTATSQITVKTKVTGITLSPTSATININNTRQFTATVAPSTASNKTINWSSSNTNVATVDSTGKVTARGNGTATITATSAENNTIKAQATVTVVTPLSSLSISPSTNAMNVNDTKTLTLTYNPTTASNKNVTWTSSNTNVATVDSTGKVTAKGNGTATITATSSENSNIKATATVTVTTKVTGVTINPTSATIYMGETKTFTATVSPSTASNKTVTWTSTNTSVATVDSNGKVTPKANGTTTIKVTTADGSKTASASVTVRTNATGVTLNKTSTIIEVNNTETLSATVAPSTTSDKTITWTSSNTNVATVDSNGKVTAVANGEVVITARTTNGKTAQCTVTVVTPVDGIHLSKTSTELKPDQTETLTYVIYPSNASNQSVTWSSNNTSVATVSNGVITAKAPGTATITAKTSDGSKQAQCTVRVITPVTKVKLNKNSTVLAVGQTDTFTATVSPSSATYKGVSWSSSNASVATVSDEGVVTAVAAGQAEITVTTNEGGKTDVATVTVYVPVDGVHLSEE